MPTTTIMSSDPQVPMGRQFPVVAIGAAAGGLSALLGVLEHLPAGADMAFVAALHLPGKDVDSALPILARGTPMPVVQLAEAATLAPGHVYLIPHRHGFAADGTSLRRLAPGVVPDHQNSLDQFFRTLADAYRSRCIGVLLSGAGTEGAVGLGRVREQGGITIAQAPEDADHDGMPRAAIAGGAVDLVLPAGEIGARLVRLRHKAGDSDSPPDEAALAEIIEILQLRTRHDFRHYKRATVLRRLQRRLQVNGLPDLPSYRDYLRDHAVETPLLLQDMLIGVTGFFRDPAAMESLARNVLPALVRDRRSDEPIRVWVVGCATGEEAYSISILMHEQAVAAGASPTVQVFATDIDDRALAVARRGIYPATIAGDVSPARLGEFFTAQDHHYRVGAKVRESVLFACHNILHDVPFSRLDLILCRNLLIYLDGESQSGILETFRRALKPRGHLFLGASETAEPGSAPRLFKAVDEKNRIYVVEAHLPGRRGPGRLAGSITSPATVSSSKVTAGPTDTAGSFPMPAAVAGGAPAAAGSADPQGQPAALSAAMGGAQVDSAQRLHHRLLLESVPASVLVDADLTILHMTSGAGQFMVHTAGAPSAALMSNIHPDLRLELRSALLAATVSGVPVQAKGVPVVWQRGNLQQRGAVDIRVVPHREPGTAAAFGLVVLEAVPPTEEPGHEPQDGSAAAEHGSEESRRLREELRRRIAQFERSSEALRATSLELAADNAALKVAAEELQTRLEETQSMNEESIAVNHDLRAKVDEAAQVSEDIQNLNAAGSIVALFVDRGLNVRRFTPAAGILFSLGSSGSGRTLADVARQLDQAPLEDHAAETLRTLQPIERIVAGADGRSYAVRIQPYRTLRDSIEGIVLIFTDVTGLLQAKAELQDAAEVFRLVVESLRGQAVIRLDQKGRIGSWNAGAARLFGYEEQEIVGQPFEVLAEAEERDRRTPESIIRLALDRGSAEREQQFRRKDGGTFEGSCAMMALHGDPGNGFVQTIRDLTDLREAHFERDNLLTRERVLDGRLAAQRRRQDELFHRLAGELRRPLNLVQVNGDMLMRLPETRSIAVVGKIAGSIGKAVATQAHVLDSVRDFSLARSGKLVLQMQTIDLAELVEDVVKSRQEQAAAKSISLEFHNDRGALMTICDHERIAEIVRHLLSNAIRATDQGRVSVRLERDGESARLSVADTGIGLAPASLGSLFNPQDRADVGSPRVNDGLGIGLPLVRDLVAAHEGRIVAESAGIDQGATFTVWLPLAETLQASGQAPSGADANPLKALRVVLVDDSLELLTAFGALLTLEGAQVESFGGAQAALQRLRQGNVDLLISDLGMPEMNGYELIAEVRRQPELAALPAIALTGYGRTRDPGHAVRSGFNAHTTKPVALEELKSIVNLLKSL